MRYSSQTDGAARSGSSFSLWLAPGALVYTGAIMINGGRPWLNS